MFIIFFIVHMHHYMKRRRVSWCMSPVAPPRIMIDGSWSAACAFLTLPNMLALKPDASLSFSLLYIWMKSHFTENCLFVIPIYRVII